MQQVTFKKLIPDLPIDQIYVADENVRKAEIESGLDDLKDSIGEISLIQPVVVIAKGNRYKLIVGQRRWLASKLLKKKTIPALVIEPMDSLMQTIVSFGENVHRRSLPYEDTIRVCDELFRDYTGSKTDRIHKIAKTLGISNGTVTRYLAYKLIPPEVQKLVSTGKISKELAFRITSAYFPDTKKIVNIVKGTTRLTKSETRRAVDYGVKKPNATMDEIMEYAKNPPKTVEIIIQVEPETEKHLQRIAQKEGSTVADVVREAIKRIIEEEMK